MSLKYKERLYKLKTVLEDDDVDLEKLRNCCITGIPDNEHLRPICWRLLLDYLPTKRSEWERFLGKHRELYSSLITDLIIGSHEKGQTAIQQDHPLNPNPESTWSHYFKDNEVLLQIDKDVRRLCPEISFFQQPTPFPCVSLQTHQRDSLSRRVANIILESEVLYTGRSGATNLVTNKRKIASAEYEQLSGGQEAHWEVVERILFIYTKLNPGVKYVQGMNEIIGPVYYVFASDPNQEWQQYAEADAFFCFQNLMSEVKDHFIKTLDDSSCGIGFTMKRLYDLLSEKDPELHLHLTEEQHLLPQFFAFRWVSLLMSQEFLLPDVIRLWDSLFADEKRFEFLLYVCLVMLINIRESLLANDFSTNLKMLQNYPLTDIAQLTIMAQQLVDGTNKNGQSAQASGQSIVSKAASFLTQRKQTNTT